MSFLTEQSAISKTPITYIIMELDYCTRTFGVAPCTATGVKCYNTFKTCKDPANYAVTTKQYKFCNADASIATAKLLDARPYLSGKEYLSSEIKDDKTITARITLTFLDENDFDIGIDPYWTNRHTTIKSVPGTFWKKLIARNPYYKGRTIKIYEGFEGIAANEFVQHFQGKIDNITRDGSNVKIECVDEIADLTQIKLPFKTNVKLNEDLGSVAECNSEDDMLKLSVGLNDYALRQDFVFMQAANTDEVGGTLSGLYYYQVIAYDSNNRPFAASPTIPFDTNPNYKITINWQTILTASYYRVFRIHNDTEVYLQTTEVFIVDDGTLSFPNTGKAPAQAIRFFKLTGAYPTVLTSWIEVTTAFTIALNSSTGLDASGYIKIDDEIMSYASIAANVLQGVQRVLYKSKGTRHYAGTNIKIVPAVAPGNPFTIFKAKFLQYDIPNSRVDLTTINALEAAWTGPNVSYKPMVKDTDAAKQLFDLAWLVDVDLWVNESGQITLKDTNNETVQHTITDANNIVLNSKSVDFNTDEIKTRILFYYDHYDMLKPLTDLESFSKLHIEIDGDAESAFMYNKELALTRTTGWLNDDCGDAAVLTAYVKGLLNKKIKRSRSPRAIINFEVESKDGSIKNGDVVSLDTDAFNDINGYDFSGKKAKVIKKNLKDATVELAVRMLPDTSITTTTEDHTNIFYDPIPVNQLNLTEVKVTGLSYMNNGVRTYAITTTVQISNGNVLVWDNMYASELTTATDIAGVTRKLATRQIYTGFPPVYYGDEVDTSMWQTVKKYNIYMFVANRNAVTKTSSVGRPNANDANGIWYLINSVPDLQTFNVNKFYQFRYMFKMEMVGRTVGFDVYADATIVYDANAAVKIDLPLMQ
ncbi:MAG: hypothetical protein WC879_03375 [Melioribacteraceae bacterium]